MPKPKYEPPMSDVIIDHIKIQGLWILNSQTRTYMVDTKPTIPQIKAEMPGDKNNASKI
jgi:hypothetical protein